MLPVSAASQCCQQLIVTFRHIKAKGNESVCRQEQVSWRKMVGLLLAQHQLDFASFVFVDYCPVAHQTGLTASASHRLSYLMDGSNMTGVVSTLQ